MATVIAVEPNALLCLGILQLLEKLPFDVTSEGIDYSQLFKSAPGQDSVDLMLLSAPDVYDSVVELVAAAQRGYDPKRILLLSNTDALTYSLLNLPPTVAGYVSKYSSREVLGAAITLVLAGGKCFPVQDSSHRAENKDDDQESCKPTATQRRRWYDRQPPPPDGAAANDRQPANLLVPTAPQQFRVPRLADSDTCAASIGPDQVWPISPALAANEAKMLDLTPRQFEVLVLFARGYSIKSASRELGISMATTKTHAQTLYQRLDVHNRYAAIRAAFSRGATLGRSGLEIARDGKVEF